MISPSLIIGNSNWAVRSGSLLGYEYGDLSGQYAPIPITGSRASSATYTDQAGTIVSASNNVLRVDYSTGTGSLLVEPQRTNLVLQSETFDNASWGKTASSITTNTTTSPDGNTTADTLTGDGTSSLHGLEQSISVTSGVTYSWSIYAKKNTNNFLQIVASSGRFGLNVWANFDLNNGVLGAVGSSTTASIQNVGNGWYRCIMTATATATGSAATYILNIISSSTSVRSESNTLTTSVFLFGAQLEVGAYPTTYTPTTSTTVTRVADSFSRSNIYTDGYITSGGGTWLAEFQGNLAYNSGNGAIQLGLGNNTTGATADNLWIAPATTGRIRVWKQVAGTLTSLFTTSTDTIKVATKWNGTTADVFVNGTKVVSATSFTPTALESLRTVIVEQPYFIPQMKLYNQPLPDAECISLTTL